MKRLIAFFSLSVILCAACEKSFLNESVDQASVVAEPDLITKAGLGGLSSNVSMEDIEDYLHFKNLSSGRRAVSVDPYTKGNDTLLYIINYEKGWELIAGDKRAPVILGHGSGEVFSLNMENEAMLSLVDCLASDIQSLKTRKDVTSFTEEDVANMNSSTLFWSLIGWDRQEVATRDLINPHDSLPFWPGHTGHWELMSVDTLEVVYDSLRLTQTTWGQKSNNYNYYCPFRTDTVTKKAPAGCVPVAGAQMLYYLHNKLNIPAFAPDTAYCSGHIGSGTYTQTTGGTSSSTWNYMLNNSINLSGYYSAAVLIADVGKKVGVVYGNDGSSAHTSDLVSVFSQYGINCTYSSFGATSNYTIKQSLQAEMPVIMRAQGSAQSTSGHAFIIDGYKRYREQYTCLYEWRWNNLSPYELPPPGIPRKTVITYSSPYITEYMMNWGWGYGWNNTFFQVYGAWNPNENNYIYNRSFIHGFSTAK